MLMFEIVVETITGAELWLGHGSTSPHDLWVVAISEAAIRFKDKIPKNHNVRIERSDNGLYVNKIVFRALT